MDIYCLFCRTEKADIIAKELSGIEGVEAISPKIIQRKWTKGVATEVAHPYLPGYVFVYTERRFDKYWVIDGLLRVLGNGPLRGSDREFAVFLKDHDGTIGTIKVYKIGERLTVANGLLQGFQGEIVKVDRQKQRLLLRFTFDSAERTVWLGYDTVECPSSNT